MASQGARRARGTNVTGGLEAGMPGSAARANALDHVVVVLAPAPLRRAQVIAAAAGPMLDD